MNRFSWLFQAGLIVLVLGRPVVLADQQATYQQLEMNQSVPARLRSDPVVLASSPTTFHVAFSGGMEHLLSVDIEGRVFRRSIRQPTEAVLITETKSEPACAVLSNDGSLLAFANQDGSISALDLKTRQIRFRHTGDELSQESSSRIVTLCFSPEDNLLAGAADSGVVRLWRANSGEMVGEIRATRSAVQTLEFSPDADQLAIASFGREVKLYRIPPHGSFAESEPRGFEFGSRVTALAFTPDGRHLAIAGADGRASVHDLSGVREPVALGNDPFAIWSLAFEPGGHRMAAGSWDGTIQLWDTKSWRLLQSLKTHEESVPALRFDNRQGLVSAGLDGRLLHWLPEVSSIAPSGIIAGRDDSVWVAVYSPDGSTLFVGGQEKRFELWDLDRNELIVTRAGHPTTRCASFSPDGKVLATGGSDGKIFLSDAVTGEMRGTLLRHPGAVSAVVFADLGDTLISGCDAGVVKVWDLTTGQGTATWRAHKQQIYCASISPDGKSLVTGGGNWTTSDPGELIVWDRETGRVRANLPGHTLAVWTIVFMPDGRRFASSDSSGAVKIWNTETLRPGPSLQHTTWVRPLAFSPDGATLAVGRGDGSIRLWDTTTWQQTASCEGHDGFTFWVQYAPHGETLVTGGRDGTVRFFKPLTATANRR